MEQKIIGKTVKTYYQGRERTCTVLKRADKKSARIGNDYWWLECKDSDIDEYHRRFMKPEYKLEVIEETVEGETMKNNITDYFDVIKQSGKEMQERNVQLRQKIADQGPPAAIIPSSEDEDEEIRLWKIEGGVVAIRFRNEKANLNDIIQYTDEFIDALQTARRR